MALDEKGITLAEVVTKYPRTFQTLGYDVLMDVDSFGKPKVISTFEMCINSILLLLKMKPGQYPSIPELGIDIEQYLHEYSDDPKIISEIQNKLYTFAPQRRHMCISAGRRTAVMYMRLPLVADCILSPKQNKNSGYQVQIVALLLLLRC
jgi:hypothetical protein